MPGDGGACTILRTLCDVIGFALYTGTQFRYAARRSPLWWSKKWGRLKVAATFTSSPTSRPRPRGATASSVLACCVAGSMSDTVS